MVVRCCTAKLRSHSLSRQLARAVRQASASLCGVGAGGSAALLALRVRCDFPVDSQTGLSFHTLQRYTGCYMHVKLLTCNLAFMASLSCVAPSILDLSVSVSTTITSNSARIILMMSAAAMKRL